MEVSEWQNTWTSGKKRCRKYTSTDKVSTEWVVIIRTYNLKMSALQKFTWNQKSVNKLGKCFWFISQKGAIKSDDSIFLNKKVIIIEKEMGVLMRKINIFSVNKHFHTKMHLQLHWGTMYYLPKRGTVSQIDHSPLCKKKKSENVYGIAWWSMNFTSSSLPWPYIYTHIIMKEFFIFLSMFCLPFRMHVF